MILINYFKIGLKKKKFSYFFLTVTIYMLFDTVMSFVLKTCDCTHVPSFKSYKVLVFTFFDLARSALCLGAYCLSKRLTDDYLAQITSRETFLEDSLNITDSLLSVSFDNSHWKDSDKNKNNFMCQIDKTEKIDSEGVFCHNISFIFKPKLFKESFNILDSSDNNLRTSLLNKNTDQHSIHLSDDYSNILKRKDSYGDCLNELGKEILKTPLDLKKFASVIQNQNNSIVEEFNFFNDFNENDLNLQELEDFLNKFMNDTYKSGFKFGNSYLILEKIIEFLELDSEQQFVNFVENFSLRINFPKEFSIDSELFNKLFLKYSISGLSYINKNKTVKFTILNKIQNKVFTFKKSVKELNLFILNVYPLLGKINTSNLYIEKKQNQLVHLMNIVINEFDKSNSEVKSVLEFVSQDFLEIPFEVPFFELEVHILNPSILNPNLKSNSKENQNNISYEIFIKNLKYGIENRIFRKGSHLRVLSNHLTIKFRKDDYEIWQKKMNEKEYISSYMRKLLSTKECWNSIEFQLFWGICKTDFIV